MKNKFSFLIILLVLIFSCNKEQKKISDSGTIHQPDKMIKPIKPTYEALQGVWAENEEENALFYIEKDSLYYVEEQDKPVKIVLKNDTLLIEGDVPVNCKILKLTSDSLWYLNQFSSDTTKLYNRKSS